jgi:type I restriction enzyme S subunit
MSWGQVLMSQILRSREDRFKPNDKAILGLKRIDKIDFSGKIFISDKTSNTDMILVKKGDLVISGINVEKGAMCVYQGEEDIVATIHYSSYEFEEDKIDSEFLTYFLKSLEFRKALKEQVPGGIKTEIKPKHLLNLLIDIPKEVEHQKSIVAELKRRCEKVGHVRNKLVYQSDLVKKLRNRILLDAIQGKLVEQNSNDQPAATLLQKIKDETVQLVRDNKLKKVKLLPIRVEEVPYQIPRTWIWCRLGDVIELVSGQDLASHEYSDRQDDGIPYITGASNLQSGKVIFNRWTKSPKSFAVDGDLLLTCKGSGVGKMAYLRFPQVHIARQIMAVRSPFICLKYVELVLFANVNYFKKNAKSLIPGIDRSQVLNLLCPLPSLAEQNRIVKELQYLEQKCNLLETSISASQLQSQNLLSEILRQSLISRKAHKNDGERFRALLLASEIIYQLNKQQTLGRIKLQKLIFLCERTQRMNLPVNFLKWAMGPYDPDLQQYLEKEMAARQWFVYNENEALKYKPLVNAGNHKADYDKHFGIEKEAINHIIQLFENARSAKIEVVATLFACWEEIIASNQLVNDTALLQRFYEWSDKKKKYAEGKIIEALRWMEAEGITPINAFK